MAIRTARAITREVPQAAASSIAALASCAEKKIRKGCPPLVQEVQNYAWASIEFFEGTHWRNPLCENVSLGVFHHEAQLMAQPNRT